MEALIGLQHYTPKSNKKHKKHIDGWLFLLVSSSDANGRGGSQVQATVSRLLCYAGFTLSRP